MKYESSHSFNLVVQKDKDTKKESKGVAQSKKGKLCFD
jgi:hypothetical protein